MGIVGDVIIVAFLDGVGGRLLRPVASLSSGIEQQAELASERNLQKAHPPLRVHHHASAEHPLPTRPYGVDHDEYSLRATVSLVRAGVHPVIGIFQMLQSCPVHLNFSCGTCLRADLGGSWSEVVE